MDIVERLDDPEWHLGADNAPALVALCREAKAEIERLREALAKFADGKNWISMKYRGADRWDGTLYAAWVGDGEPEAIAFVALHPTEPVRAALTEGEK